MTVPTKIDYWSIRPFENDLKRLIKKFRTLEDDIETVKRNAIELRHLKQMDNLSIFLIPGYCSGNILIYKIKKIACRSLKGRGVQSGIRIIYAFHKAEQRVVFIEIYHKSDQPSEDRGRIKQYLNDIVP